MESNITSKLLLASLLTLPLYSIQATMFDTVNKQEPMAFLPVRYYSFEKPEELQTNTLVLKDKGKDKKFNISVDWKLKNNINESKDVKVAVSAKF